MGAKSRPGGGSEPGESGDASGLRLAGGEHAPVAIAVATPPLPADSHAHGARDHDVALIHRHLGGFALLPFARHFVLFQFFCALRLLLGYGAL